jgi:DNA-binding PadR family transcriptional regulator
MPETKSADTKLPTDEQLIAAIDRAERHRLRHDDRPADSRRPEKPGAWLETVKEHLGLNRGGWTTRQLRPQLDRLQAAGLIEQVRRNGAKVWHVTEAGQRHLEAEQRTGRIPPLPESPQHRVWREARSQAEELIDSFRLDMRERLTGAASLLAAGDEVGSDRWITMAERLQFACERLSSATYCLFEWAEPDDAASDRPESRYLMRRDIHRWDRHEPSRY